MYFASDWFPSLFDCLPEFLRIVNDTRGVKSWLNHVSKTGIEYKSLYHSYDTKTRDKCIIESHKRTIDFQYCYSGGEIISFSPNSICETPLSYNEEIDKCIWDSRFALTSSISLKQNSFILFEPNQLHRPQQFNGVDKSVEKIVLKLPIEFLSL